MTATITFDSVGAKQIKGLEAEIAGLEGEANQLARNIEQLTEQAVPDGNLA